MVERAEGLSVITQKEDKMEFDSVKDGEPKVEYTTGGVRGNPGGKGRYDLLPPYAIHRIARHFENGAVKYEDRNWERGLPVMRYLDSALRHTFQLLDGDTSEDHAAAAIWNLMCYMQTLYWVEEGLLPLELDNRPD